MYFLTGSQGKLLEFVARVECPDQAECCPEIPRARDYEYPHTGATAT